VCQTQRKSINHKFAYPSFYITIPFAHFDISWLFVHLDAIDILKHLVIELICLIFEECAYFFTGHVHKVLFGNLVFLYLVQKLNHVVDSIIQNQIQLASIFHVDTLFYEMAQSYL